MKYTALISFTLASALAVPVFADSTNTPVVDKRAANQDHRIEQGEKSGALTNREAAHLEKREDKLQANEAAAKADGKVTPKERTQLKHEENRDSKAIHRKKHNARVKKSAE